MKILLWIARVTAAVIMLQTLYFKFTGAPESIYIFTTIGMEPFGRYASGVGELLAAILLFIPNYNWLGALIGMGAMSGALFFHLTKLGIEVQGDSGTLFYLAIITFTCCAFIAFVNRKSIPIIGAHL
jgi:uncharacterized membrane protein YphA (DoxX/SURF4 family)